MHLLKHYIKQKKRYINRLLVYYSNTLAMQIFMGFIGGILLYNALWLGFFYSLLLYKLKLKVVLITILSISTGIIVTHYHTTQIIQEQNVYAETIINSTGEIIEPPSIREFNQSILLKLDNIQSNIIATVPKYPQTSYTDTVYIEGQLSPIEKNDRFSDGYKSFLKSKNIHFEMQDPYIEQVIDESNSINMFQTLADVKLFFANRIKTQIHEPFSALTNGMVFGATESLSDDVGEQLQRTGTSHITSASGFNVVIIYIFFSSLSFILPKRLLSIISIITIILYVILIGVYIVPAIRAAIMLIIVIIGSLLGRKHNVLVSLLGSMSIILLPYPFTIYNVSFQLSAAATLGLFTMTPVIQKFIGKLRIPDFLNEGISSTIAATLATLPISIFIFESSSSISIVSNALILPIVPLITLFGIVAITVSGIPIISDLIFTILTLLNQLLFLVVEVLAKLPFAFIEDKQHIIIYGLVLLLAFIGFDLYNFYETSKRDTYQYAFSH